ncbi:RimK/LysX family protein [Vibrio sp. WXL103]|uniref:putative ATP-dependent zinc protease n=1 Tax=Vibrio sp. WXL103 TaxID=3450710 RepID=UPI003EC61D24
MRKKALTLAASLALILATPVTAQSNSALQATTQHPAFELDGLPVLGGIENVYYDQIPELEGVAFTGKIDTGADTTSMHALDVEIYSNNPKYQDLKNEALLMQIVEDLGGVKTMTWRTGFAEHAENVAGVVSFVIPHPYTGELVRVERPLHRPSVVRSRTSEQPIYRPVIELPLTIAGTTVMTEINLTDRAHFSAPILIGKTFLKENAWVFTGYDFLQAQSDAQLIGKREVVSVEGLDYTTSLSLANRYSIFHATDIEVDEKKRQVSFVLHGNDKSTKAMTLPLVRTARISGNERPLVYLPVEFGHLGTKMVLGYPADRSKSSSTLRLGHEILNQWFMIDTDRNQWLDGEGMSYQATLAEKPLVLSPVEQVQIDGIPLPAEPSFVVQTSLLRVSEFELEKKGKSEFATFTLTDQRGEPVRITKPVERKVRVGETVRPIIRAELTLGKSTESYEIALGELSGDETQAHFVLGQTLAQGELLVDTRTEYILDSYPLFKAGYVEQVTVEGLTFPAKLDTGADVTSINATNIEQYERDGKQMVSFTYSNSLGQEQDFTLEVVDVMRIRAKAGEETNVRPVVKMNIKLGEVEQQVRVNLQDRSRFEYSMILGKNFLKYGAVVSSDEQYLYTDNPNP